MTLLSVARPPPTPSCTRPITAPLHLWGFATPGKPAAQVRMCAAVWKACRELNEIATHEFGVPFHLAAARGNGDFFEKVMARNGLSREVLGNSEDGAARAFRCSYSRSVYPGLPWPPWKLRRSFRTRLCSIYYKHGPFRGTISRWYSPYSIIWGMVFLNGWNSKLPADGNHFYYKFYTLIPFGLTPCSCHWMLYAGVY